MTCPHQAGRQHAAQILWLDFDRFLASPQEFLQQVSRR
jgi:hypothetical protein